jgi:hypothetical protein
MSVIQESLVVLDNSKLTDGLESHKCFVSLISATGRGSAEPVFVSGEEDRPHSRRVVFKIRIKGLEERKEIVAQTVVHDVEPVAR